MDAASHARRILAKAGDFYPQLISALEQYGGRGLWIHFSDIPKVGIRPNPTHKDPVGVYFFPLDHIASDFSRYHHWAFRKYMFVCRVDAASVLDLSAVTNADMESMLSEAGVEEGSQAWSAGYLHGGTPGGRLWRALDETARSGGEWGSSRGMAFRRLLKGLGYDAVRDPGTGTIHGNEPDQLIALDPADIEVVEMVETTTKPYDADAYYRDPKYPFHGRSTKPALELLGALAALLGLEPGRVSSHGKGSWAMRAKDADGNEIRLAEELHTSGAADYVSFRAKLSASWYSDGMQVYETSNGPHGHGLEFDVRSDYGEIVAPFAEQLRAKFAEAPMDDTSHVEGPLRGIADAIGGAKVSAESPVRGTLTKKVGESELRISLGFEHPESSYRAEEPSYDVSGVVALPRSPVGDMSINPSFGHDIEPIPVAGVVGKVVESLPKWIREVMETHFPEGDTRYDHIRRHTAPVLELLEGRTAPAKAAGYHRILSWLKNPPARG